ncbi:MAG: histone deacetylase family protein [Burkholderiaceae bacterium]|nr:MAG: histone deacetylase family protein [Burkholderiaceae bacterium]
MTFGTDCAYITHPSSLLHEMGAGHPESPQRVRAIELALTHANLLERMQAYTAPAASDEQLKRVHATHHLQAICEQAPAHGYHALDADTVMNPHTLTAARHAAGALVLAVDLVLRDEVQRAFCNVRPPGHHAERGRAMGFCFFNNVAVGMAHALAAHSAQRVAAADFDVHHGNGTETIFADAPGVLMVSTFQSPLYPYSGEQPLGENMVNVPLPSGSNGRLLRQAVEEVWLPALDQFAPQLLFISAGFDAHRADPLAGLNWVEDDYAWVTQQLVAVANRHCNGRVISTLEGGYALDALAASAVAHVGALLD